MRDHSLLRSVLSPLESLLRAYVFRIFLQIDAELQRMDDVIASLLDGIAQLGLSQCLNIMVLADHGEHDVTLTSRVSYQFFLTVPVTYRNGGVVLRFERGVSQRFCQRQ